MKKRLLSMFLTVALLIGMLPTAAFALDTEQQPVPVHLAAYAADVTVDGQLSETQWVPLEISVSENSFRGVMGFSSTVRTQSDLLSDSYRESYYKGSVHTGEYDFAESAPKYSPSEAPPVASQPPGVSLFQKCMFQKSISFLFVAGCIESPCHSEGAQRPWESVPFRGAVVDLGPSAESEPSP